MGCGGGSSVFLFSPLFVMIPLGKSSILEREGKEEKEGGQRGSDLIKEIKCRSLKFVVLRWISVVLEIVLPCHSSKRSPYSGEVSLKISSEGRVFALKQGP